MSQLARNVSVIENEQQAKNISDIEHFRSVATTKTRILFIDEKKKKNKRARLVSLCAYLFIVPALPTTNRILTFI